MKTGIERIAAKLREHIARQDLSRQAIEEATQQLKDAGYTYNQKKYPPLSPRGPGVMAPANHNPNNLAEALLWKLGKWTAYQNFSEFYHSGKKRPDPSTRVVFDAFALHFKNRK